MPQTLTTNRTEKAERIRAQIKQWLGSLEALHADPRLLLHTLAKLGANENLTEMPGDLPESCREMLVPIRALLRELAIESKDPLRTLHKLIDLFASASFPPEHGYEKYDPLAPSSGIFDAKAYNVLVERDTNFRTALAIKAESIGMRLKVYGGNHSSIVAFLRDLPTLASDAHFYLGTYVGGFDDLTGIDLALEIKKLMPEAKTFLVTTCHASSYEDCLRHGVFNKVYPKRAYLTLKPNLKALTENESQRLAVLDDVMSRIALQQETGPSRLGYRLKGGKFVSTFRDSPKANVPSAVSPEKTEVTPESKNIASMFNDLFRFRDLAALAVIIICLSVGLRFVAGP